MYDGLERFRNNTAEQSSLMETTLNIKHSNYEVILEKLDSTCALESYETVVDLEFRLFKLE